MKLRHYLWCILVVGLAGCLFYWQKGDEVFPAASIDLRISKKKVTELAEQWAHRLGYDEVNPIKSTIFAFDDDAKTYLEYELGQTRANTLMHDTVPVWYWSTRLCKPLKQEEFTSWISPDGRLVSFEHDIENDRKMPSLSHEKAEKLAEEFVKDVVHLSLDGYTIAEQGSVTQAHRTDNYFTWEQSKSTLAGAKLRTHVYISGDKVTAFNHFLYVPEAWTRKFAKLRSYNDALADAASIFWVALNTGACFIFIWAFASGRIRWKMALIVASVYGVFAILENLNSLPTSIHEYNTTLPFEGFKFEFGFSVLMQGVYIFLQILVLTAAAEAIYRVSFPQGIAFERLFTKDGLRSRHTLYGILAGLGTFGMHLGFIALFYLLGRRVGFWCPLEVQNVETLSSTAPFFSAMHVGWYASLTEELTYRVIGLAAFQKLTKNFWLANLLQAAAWAFMHSNYPQEPPYARGLELTCAGFLYGVVLRYFGILPCIFSHNLLDTFLGVQPLLASNLRHMQGQAAIALAPYAVILIAALVCIRRYGWLDNDEPLENKTITHAQPALAEAVQEILPAGYNYQALSGRLRWLLGILAVAFAAVNFFCFIPTIGSKGRLTIARGEAIGIARQYLLENGVRPDGLSIAAELISGLDGEQMQYVFENDRARVRQLCMKPESPLLWKVRFFKPLVEEEYYVFEDGHGKPISFTLVEPEKAPGARLPLEAARKKVEAFLNKEHPEVQPYSFDDVTETKRDARTDYTFSFKVPQYKVGEADYRVSVEVIGDKVSGFGDEWVIPDNWKFDRNKRRLREIICSDVVIAFALACMILALMWARGVIRSQAITWRPAIFLATGLVLLSLAQSVNNLPQFYLVYRTDNPLVSFFVSRAVDMSVGWISTFALIAGVAAFGLASLKLLLPTTSVVSILKTTFVATSQKERLAKYNLWTDAVLLGLVGGLGVRALALGLGAIHAILSPVVTLAPIDSFCDYANVSNATVSAGLTAFVNGFYYVFLAAILVGIYAKFVRTPAHYALFAVLASFLLPSSDRYWQDYMLDVISYLSSFTFSWLFVTRLAKENLLAYFIMGVVYILANSIHLLTRLGSAVFLEDIAAQVAILLAPVFYLLIMRANLSRTGEASPQSSPSNPDASDA